jgi:hypothetical protein
MDFKKKLSSLEVIVNNQIKMKSEESFMNYFDMNGGDMNFSIIGKGKGNQIIPDKDESVIHDFGVLDGLMSSEKRMSNVHPIKNNQPLTPVSEIEESRTKPTNAPIIPAKIPKAPSKAQESINEVTGNSFFNDVSLPHSLNTLNTKIPSTTKQVQNKISSESNKPQKIKREHVNNDLNCTLHDASVLEYMVDQNGYLLDQNGNPVYNDMGKMVKLTEDQIDNFKENELYEEMNS